MTCYLQTCIDIAQTDMVISSYQISITDKSCPLLSLTIVVLSLFLLVAFMMIVFVCTAVRIIELSCHVLYIVYLWRISVHVIGCYW